MMIDILLWVQAIPYVIGTTDYAIGTAIPYILGAIGAGVTGAWVKNNWQNLKNVAGNRIVRPLFGSERKRTFRSDPMIAQPDATRVVRPIVVPTREVINLHLGEKRAIPVYGKQSGTSTPVMGKKKKITKARPTITRTPDAAQRDTVRVTNGAAVENTAPQGTTKVDDRNILQRLGDRMARRKRQNNSTTNPENKPPRKWWDKTKTGLKWGMYGFVANEADNKIFGGGVKKIVKGVLDLGFDKPDTVYVQQSAKNGVQQQQAESVQKDTTKSYNGFLINQQNLVE